MLYRKLVIKKIDKIDEILSELQYRQIELLINIQKNQSSINNKLDKLQEFNEIDDMNNAVMFKKLQQIYEKI
ncbi:MAG: hypothetical protein J6J36_03775 [Clostridia bacterium]|nr:hypothetical protein [Clostridia bacterium]